VVCAPNSRSSGSLRNTFSGRPLVADLDVRVGPNERRTLVGCCGAPSASCGGRSRCSSPAPRTTASVRSGHPREAHPLVDAKEWRTTARGLWKAMTIAPVSLQYQHSQTKPAYSYRGGKCCTEAVSTMINLDMREHIAWPAAISMVGCSITISRTCPTWLARTDEGISPSWAKWSIMRARH